MKKILSAVLAAIFALAACETIQPEGVEDGSSSKADSYVFTASLGKSTRTSLEYDGKGYNVVWSESDQIIIWDSLAFCGGYLDDKYEICSLASGAGTPDGKFIASIQADSYVALYCDNNHYKYPNGGYPQIELPLLQNDKRSDDGSLMDDIAAYQYPMIAISNSRKLEFNNLCSILRVAVTGNGETLNSIVVTSKNGEALSGTATIQSLADHSFLNFSEGNKCLVYRTYESLTSIPKVFNIVIPAQCYSEGLEIEVFTDHGSMTVSTGDQLTICRSRFYDIAIDFQAKKMPDGLYLVGRTDASDLTSGTAEKYALVETQAGRYEKFLYMYPNNLYTLEYWKDGKVTEYAVYDHFDRELNSGYDYRMSTVVPMEESRYYITLPSLPFSTLVHVVLNMGNEYSPSPYIALMPVRWHMRGTFNAWGMTDMTPYVYDSTIIQYYLPSVIFDTAGSSFKFDYSGEWSIALDDGYECVTNLGADGDMMGFHGADITVPERGVYDVTLTWYLIEGTVTGCFFYSIEKIADVPERDYSKCQLELVGTSVAEGTPDTSSWQWGNVLLADRDGYPFFMDDVFSWTWYGVYLYASDEVTGGDAGFKIRSVGAQMVDSVPYVDYGVNGPSGANMTVDMSGYYNVFFYIDAKTGEMRHEIALAY